MWYNGISYYNIIIEYVARILKITIDQNTMLPPDGVRFCQALLCEISVSFMDGFQAWGVFMEEGMNDVVVTFYCLEPKLWEVG